MKLLVTGGAGFIGSNFTRKALSLGHSVLVIDNLSTGKQENIPDGAELHEYDILDLGVDSLVELMKSKEIDAVLHFAALPRIPLSIEEPLLTNDHNVKSTLIMLQATHLAGVKKFIYSASSSAYGEGHPIPLHESYTPHPANPYAVQKHVGELYCKVFSDLHGLETTCLRYFNVYGPGMAFEGAYTTVVANFIRALMHGEGAEVHGDGLQRRDFTYIDDVVMANILALQKCTTSHGLVLNVGRGSSQSILDIAKYLGVDYKHIDARVGDVKETMADTRRIKSFFKWTPSIPLHAGLDMTKNYYMR